MRLGSGGVVKLGIVALSLLISGCGPVDSSPTPNGTTGDTRYVQASALRARTSPSESATIIGSLPQGSAVNVMERQGSWVRVEQGDSRFWVAERHIGASRPRQFISGSDDARSDRKMRQPHSVPQSVIGGSDDGRAIGTQRMNTNLKGVKTTSVKKTRKTRKTRNSVKKRRQSLRSESYGGSCPCRGGHVCIGPRGGRYCITSGGNKRYGV